ncbi:MAG: phage/plasmid primase, P4 family [Clostridiales bacterium]|nr:phage/plasmid primase, P4 family [Clostridiales bacterium]
MTYEEFLQHFKISRRYGDKAQCICPAHSDNKASLTITKGNRGTLIKCHAGCTCEEVLTAVGLAKSDLFYEDRHSQDEAWKHYVEKREGRKVEERYDYVFINGDGYAFTKLRLDNKDMKMGMMRDGKFKYSLREYGGRKAFNALYIPQGLKAISKAITNGEMIFLPEGEKDVNTLTSNGYISLTYGSEGDWQKNYAEIFRDARVVILADNDPPGARVAARASKDIGIIAKSVKIITPMPDLPHGDVSDYFAAGHTKEEFEQLVSRETEQERPLQETVSATAGSESLVRKLEQLDACNNYPANDMGTSRLFAEVFKDECRYSPTVKDWMHYDGIMWQRDYEGMAARGCCKQLADAFLKYAVSCNLDGERRTAYLKYAVSLTSYRVRNTIVNDSREINRFTSEQMDADDYLLNCLNGTLVLSEVKPLFREHRPDDLISKVSGTNYDPAAKYQLWEKTLDEIFEGDTGKIDYLQKLLGYCLTGCTKEEQMYFLYGASTRNGKSTITETSNYILGDYAATISPETLAVKQNKDSRTASPDIAKLAGARLVIASEPQKRMLFDSALVKALTGRDRITARHLYENEFSFIPKFKLILNTNYLPTITDPTIFKSGRIKVLSFNRHFAESEQDLTLKEKLRSEASGILNWMIEGYYKYKTDGLKPPESVTRDTEEYQHDSDKLQKFIDECLIESKGNCKAGDAYKTYAEWCRSNGQGIESKGNFFSDLKTKGIFKDTGTVNGATVKNVIAGYVIDIFTEIQPDEMLPFA